MKDHIALGAVSKPHGLGGEVRVHPYNVDSPMWKQLSEVLLAKGENSRLLKVRSSRKAPKHFVVRFEGVDDRDAAEALRGFELWVPRDSLPALQDDEFYFADVEELPVMREGAQVGVVVRVLEYPASMCLEIRSDDGVREVPMRLPWIIRIDLEEQKVEVGPWDDVPIVGS